MPTLTVEIAVATGFTTDWADVGDYLDVSDRVMGFSMQRGRDDKLAEFDSGTITLVLDASDGGLDDFGSGRSWADCPPMSPVRITATYSGTTYPVFYGFIGPEAWQFTRPIPGTGGVVTVTVPGFDKLQAFQSIYLPSSPFACYITSLTPYIWLRGNAESSVLANAATIPDHMGITDGVVVDSGAGQVVELTSSIVPDDAGPSLFCEAGARVSVNIGGGVSDYTVMVMWSGTTNAADQSVIRANASSAGTGNARWQLVCNTSGDLVLTAYDNSGSAVTFGALPANPAPSSSGRWDDGTAHLIAVRVNGSAGSRNIKTFADSVNDTLTSASIPTTYGSSYLFAGSSVADQTLDEIAYWPSLLTTAQVQAAARVILGTGMPFAGETVEQRIQRIYDLCGYTVDGSESAQWHTGSDDGTLWGMGSVLSLPDTLTSALQQVASSQRGTAWCTRDGRVRVRTDSALFNASYTADYLTKVANLTDEVSPAGSPTPIRRAIPQWSGLRLDRVVTYGTGTCGTGSGYNPTRVVSFYRDLTAIGYGVHPVEWTTLDQTADVPTGLRALVDVNTDPASEVQEVRITCYGDDAATKFALALELEQWLTLTDSRYGTATGYDLSVQSIGWEWVPGETWNVTLTLARTLYTPVVP